MGNEQETNNKKKTEDHIIRIGSKLRKVLDQQKKQIKEATYDCVNPSDFEAGEIIAKKVSSVL